MSRKQVEVDVGGRKLILESGLMARQAAGAVFVRFGDTVVFSAVTTSKEPRANVDFLPLQVEYREKFYAAGRFPGGYFKRESRPSEREILTARVTDRPLRPLFPDGFYNEVQINSMLMCTDGEMEPDFLSINAASAALMLSELPFMGPVAAVRVGRVNGQIVLNPTHKELETSDLNLTYVGTHDRMMMVEGSANEVPEAVVFEAMKVAQAEVVKIAAAQIELRRAFGLPDKVKPAPVVFPLEAKMRPLCAADLTAAVCVKGKLEREGKVSAIKKAVKAALLAEDPALDQIAFNHVFDLIEVDCVRRNVLERGIRIDGRSSDELRPLYGEVALLPRTHGSAMFQRGETQALAVVTLGSKTDAQSLDAVTGGPNEKTFILHYNFPPFSTGEAGRLGSTSRREIGHGNLAERSLAPVVPKDYPYSIRLVSEIMESNGSSSMASVCVGTLALMDAGVPIRKPVAGISIGLFTDESKAVLVTDIIGSEDHCGDMDFKVSGTRDGVTGIQVDLKIHGMKWEWIEGALAKAHTARMQILDFIAGVLPEPRADLSQYAPRIVSIKIDPENIGGLIGPGGKNIRRICELSGAQIDIEDDGSVNIFSADKKSLDLARAEIEGMFAEPEIDRIYQGAVTGIKDFGVFVEIMPGRDGLVHISELADYRVGHPEDVCKIGDQMWVKCIGVDDRGKIKLSRKAAMKERGEQTPAP